MRQNAQSGCKLDVLDLLPKECLHSHTERCTSVDVAVLSVEKDDNVC